MQHDDPEKGEGGGSQVALLEVKDVLGLSKPADTLLKGLGYGIAATTSFLTSRWRNGIAIKNFDDWNGALANKGGSLDKANLTLNERAELQVSYERERTQKNLEEVGFHAVEAHRLALEDGKAEAGTEIDGDWLENFWSLAGRITSRERQELWGKILSRQSLEPGSISVRTLKFLADLTPHEAEKLQAIAACSYYCPDAASGPEAGMIYNVYLPAIGTPETLRGSSEDLPRDVLPSRDASIFVPAGFWLTAGGFAHALVVPLVGEIRLRIGNRWFVVRKSSGTFVPDARIDHYATLFHAEQITELGREVLELIDASPSARYIAELSKSLGRYGTADLIEMSVH